ncbi:hypothetical protein L1987_20339 [Smallanthus sonchifolius]|uniref:Uncharacterized protein n=1 Tax=Smallanthus sonchifolius TaxID=185202 RepID=A0ACB9IUG6_9ASTR|nr:hypothetical protein L1987_20339 [Smallanthus sonchifolius]
MSNDNGTTAWGSRRLLASLAMPTAAPAIGLGGTEAGNPTASQATHDLRFRYTFFPERTDGSCARDCGDGVNPHKRRRQSRTDEPEAAICGFEIETQVVNVIHICREERRVVQVAGNPFLRRKQQFWPISPFWRWLSS